MAANFNQARMNRIVLILILFGVWTQIQAQTEPEEEKLRVTIVEDRWDDKILLELTNDMWLDLPEGVELSYPSIGFKAYFFTDYTFTQESNLSFAWGFGVSVDNVRSNAEFVSEEFPNGEVGPQILTPFAENYDYELNKFVTTYLEIPIEFRFITKGKHPFRLAAGFRVGYMIGNHQKIIDTEGKRKYYAFDDMEKFRYGVSARIGYSYVQLTGYYSLVPLVDYGTEVVPVSIGLAFTLIR
jgi:hypothetical protein